jgi:hypothetical protein
LSKLLFLRSIGIHLLYGVYVHRSGRSHAGVT